MYIALYVLAAIGGLLLLCGFLGCCGACMESPALLGTVYHQIIISTILEQLFIIFMKFQFFFIILVLFLAEIAGGIYIFVKKDQVFCFFLLFINEIFLIIKINYHIKMREDLRTWFRKVFIDTTDEEAKKQLKSTQDRVKLFKLFN